ncbi:MAG TPA: DUF2905 domain-containing protein [Xanthomonadales bacterium]|nr:DUF2905 domain-containing protein [Xanthomonadales bacterium]
MNAGAVLVLAGIALVAIGLLAWSGALSWFGHLPGDIRVQRESSSFFMPITSMLVVSVALSLLFALVRRFFG